MTSVPDDSRAVSTDRSASWNNPNSLGWNLWRRTQATGLLTQRVQRDLAHYRLNRLMVPAPLASEIRMRWGVGHEPGLYRYNLDLPLFRARLPFLRGNTPDRFSPPEPAMPRRFTDISRISLAYDPSRLSEATTSPNLPANEAGTRSSEPATAPQAIGGSAAEAANQVARHLEASPVLIKPERSAPHSARTIPTTTLALQKSLLPRRLTTTIQSAPLDRGTMRSSSTIVERHNLLPGSLQKLTNDFSESAGRSVFALPSIPQPALRPSTVARAEPATASGSSVSLAEAPARSADRAGKLQTRPQNSATVSAQAKRYEADRDSPGDLLLTSPVELLRESTTSPTALSKSSGAGLAPDRSALMTIRDFTGKSTTGNSTTQGSGVGGATTLRLGGMMGVISRAPVARSLPWLRLPLSLTMRQQEGQIPVAPCHSFSARLLSKRAPLATLFRSPYGHAPGLEPTFRVAESDAASRASYTSAEDARVQRTVSRKQAQMDWMDSPVNKVRAETAETGSAPSIGLMPTNPANSQKPANLTRSVPSQINDRASLADQTSDPGLTKFGGGAMPVFTARKTMVGSGLNAAPLSMMPIFKRASSRAAVDHRIFADRSLTVAGAVSRTADQEPSRFDASVRGGEAGAMSGIFPGGGAGVTQRASHKLLVCGPLLSRADYASAYRSGDEARRTSGVTSMPLSGHGERPGPDVNASWSMDLSISRMALPRMERNAISDNSFLANRQGWLPISHDSSRADGSGRNQSSAQRFAERFAAPLSVARSAVNGGAFSAYLPGKRSATDAAPATEIFAAELIRAGTAGASSEFHPSSSGLTPALALMRSATITPAALMRRADARAHQEPQALMQGTRETSYDMPFAVPAVLRAGRSLAGFQGTNGSALHRAPQETASAASRVLQISTGPANGRVETPTPATKPQIDLDELVEKAWRKLMRRLAIEQERRGYTRWR